ncbi:SRPBCC family protein [Bailinhaonella thermotolerans]|uniref:SRPBCC domain-containing protein n=1 Tax=Bailinhaonella thermotolerans TaxID=1070861 RepID=A0A3A4ARG5_9ACTN|nr:SRPBCC domain-containing protein [Bailinhaonella thermotolerans]RJL30985.1 SRPBCC domain-containing protein [Bailinhaonella thermotolerans]
MAEQKPFRVEVSVGAPREAVWRALTEPAEIRRWHGWEYDGLDEEIRFIYVDHAKPSPPGEILLDDGAQGQKITLLAEGTGTLVRVARPGSLPDDGAYDDIEQGWVCFLQQLRHYLEHHPGEDRATLRLEGLAAPDATLAAVRDRFPGETRHSGRFQHDIATARPGRGLLVFTSHAPLDSSAPAPVTLTLTAHGPGERELTEAREDLRSWWSSLVSDPRTVPPG